MLIKHKHIYISVLAINHFVAEEYANEHHKKVQGTMVYMKDGRSIFLDIPAEQFAEKFNSAVS